MGAVFAAAWEPATANDDARRQSERFTGVIIISTATGFSRQPRVA